MLFYKKGDLFFTQKRLYFVFYRYEPIKIFIFQKKAK
jgi:hypothetical protein